MVKPAVQKIVSILQKVPWKRAFLILLGGVVSYIVIPLGFDRYSELKSTRDVRLAKAIRFADQNATFNSKVNVAATVLRQFASHNGRTKPSAPEMAEAHKDLFKGFQERRLDLDEAAWWWPGEFVREASALDLLSPKEMEELRHDVESYKESVLRSVNQVTYLWRFLDSPDYCLTDQSATRLREMEATMDKEFENEYNARSELVTKISLLLTRSEHRTAPRDLLGV